MISLLFVDMFDTVGTVVGVAQQADYLDEKGELPKAGKVLLADAIGTTGGALFGTSTVTTYVESAAGVGAGGRTGLTGVFVSLFFILALFFQPLVSLIPAVATAPALIIVGAMMITNMAKLDWNDFTEVFPAFITMVFMPFTYSIANGIALGFIVYPFVKLATGKGKEVHWLVYVLGVFSVLYLYVYGTFSKNSRKTPESVDSGVFLLYKMGLMPLFPGMKFNQGAFQRPVRSCFLLHPDPESSGLNLSVIILERKSCQERWLRSISRILVLCSSSWSSICQGAGRSPSSKPNCLATK